MNLPMPSMQETEELLWAIKRSDLRAIRAAAATSAWVAQPLAHWGTDPPPLVLAVRVGSTRAVELMLELDLREPGGEALLEAIRLGNEEMIRLLATPESLSPDSSGITLLHRAVVHFHAA